jgi:hypothetical protein
MMASWKSKHVAKYYLKLQTYFINCCVVTAFNKEIYHPLNCRHICWIQRQSFCELRIEKNRFQVSEVDISIGF